MKEIFEKIIQLAREWRDFSKDAHEWSCEEYVDGDIDCYFADNSDHTSVSFRVGKQGFDYETIQVSFHYTPTINGFTARTADFIEDDIVRYTCLLEEIRAKYKTRNEAEAEQAKQLKIQALKRQLASLINE